MSNRNSAKRIAFRDITKYLAMLRKADGDKYGHWMVDARELDTKEQRELNRQLGLRVVNRKKEGKLN